MSEPQEAFLNEYCPACSDFFSLLPVAPSDKKHKPKCPTGQLLSEVDRLKAENIALRGCLDTDEERQRQAGQSIGIAREEWGCDWPEKVADLVDHLRSQVQKLSTELAKIHHILTTPIEEDADAELTEDLDNHPLF